LGGKKGSGFLEGGSGRKITFLCKKNLIEESYVNPKEEFRKMRRNSNPGGREVRQGGNWRKIGGCDQRTREKTVC